ncbi:polysaccharide deacetylase family protein [Salinilacihabitans rarus]|uniref:polysaccharide deacetylase family protein n=1 Tax=Salinilacihabitans rarus TaxID=2961596 RepID=UPI0020C8E062|nr:polysaccharide deacetylase family protein [Salinilacihabitans rarus]
MKRRKYLAAATAAAVLAGCAGGEETDDPTNETDNDEESTNETDDEEESTSETDEETEESTGADVETFDDFEDLDAWETVMGSLSADEERYYDGSQSALLEAATGDQQVRIVRELDSTEDFSGMRPGLAMTAETTVDPVIQLIDDDGNRIDFRQELDGGLPMTRCNFGVAEVDGDPDLSEVAEIQIALWTGTEYEGRLWVDDLHFVPTPETGKVMLQFDGGYETDYTSALPLLDEYGYPATSFITTGRLRGDEEHDGDRLVEDHVGELADAGWTIASHTAHGTILTDPGERDREAEVADAKEWLEDEGFEDGARFFSYPGGQYDVETYELVEEYHDVAFAGRYPAQGYAANPLLCSRVTDPGPDEARRALDLTAEFGGITSLCYYRLDGGSRSALEAALAHLSDLEEAGEVEVITPTEFEEYMA